jgi:HEAT repeat protein
MLLQQLVHGSLGESNRAIDRLRFLGPSVAGPALQNLLESNDSDARVAASGALVVIHYRGAEHALENALAHDDDWEIRRNAVNALAALHDRRASRLMAQALRTDTQPRVRKACATALATLGGSDAALVTGASDANIEVRLAALDGLAHSMDRHIAPRLRPLLTDSSGLVRFAAARALAWSNDTAGRRFLTEAVGSSEPEFIRRGVTALSDVPHGWATELLVHTLDSADGEAAVNAGAALARRKDVRGTRYLMKVASSGGPEASKAQEWLDRIAPADPDADAAGGNP